MSGSFKRVLGALCLSVALAWNSGGVSNPRRMEQSPEVLEAYRLCNTFQRVMAEDLDFDRAYEATFPKGRTLRRAIAIAEGEFGLEDYSSVDDELLIRAYKLRMQIFYLLLPLAGPSDEEEKLFFPPKMRELLERRPPAEPVEFPAFVRQLEKDATVFRNHVRRLSANNHSVVDRINQFKSVELSANLTPPADHIVESGLGYYRTAVLGSDVPYYQIGCFVVALENGQMRIFDIKFFTRLF